MGLQPFLDEEPGFGGEIEREREERERMPRVGVLSPSEMARSVARAQDHEAPVRVGGDGGEDAGAVGADVEVGLLE